MKFWVKVESREFRIIIEDIDDRYVVEIDGRKHTIDCRAAGYEDRLSLIIDSMSHLIACGPVKIEEGKYFANISGRRFEIEVLDERLIATRQAAAKAKEDGPYVLKSPMPGLIIDVLAKPGDKIAEGSAVVVIEAMKMQNELVSEVNGTVREVNVKPQETVDSQAPLLVIERSE